MIKECKKHGAHDRWVKNGKGGYKCGKCNYEKIREWRSINKDKKRSQDSAYRARNPGKVRDRIRKWRAESPSHRESQTTMRKRQTRYNSDIKSKVFNAYGGFVCSECGISDPDVLTIDHINPDTKVSRRDVGNILRRRLAREGFPPGYQVLCFNCNIKKHREYERGRLNAS